MNHCALASDLLLRGNCAFYLLIAPIVQFIELFNVKLSMLGHHQLKNAATATCAALCLRGQGEK